MRQSVEIVGGAVQGIDDPACAGVHAGDDTALFHQKAELRSRPVQLVIEDLLGAAVGLADEIGRPLARDLQLLDFAEVAAKPARRLHRGRDHDIDER